MVLNQKKKQLELKFNLSHIEQKTSKYIFSYKFAYGRLFSEEYLTLLDYILLPEKRKKKKKEADK